MGTGRRPALLDILCNNKVASHGYCSPHPSLHLKAEVDRTPAVAPTGSERSVRETQAAQPGIARVPLCGMDITVNELQQHVQSDMAVQGDPLLSSLQRCGATRHHSSPRQASAVPLSEQIRVHHIQPGQISRSGLKKRDRMRQLGACNSNAKAADQHAPSVPELQTCGEKRTDNGAMQQCDEQLQSSSSLPKLRQIAVHPSHRRPFKRRAKQQKVLVLGAGQSDRHLHVQRKAPTGGHARFTGVPSNFNYYEHGHGCWDSEMAGVEGMSGMGLDMWEGVGTIAFGGGFGPQ